MPKHERHWQASQRNWTRSHGCLRQLGRLGFNDVSIRVLSYPLSEGVGWGFESGPPRNERGEDALNSMGRDGWELTAFTPDLARPDSYVAIFRRRY